MCCARKDNRVRMAHNARPASDMAFILLAFDLTVACCVGYSHTESIDFCVYRVLMPGSAAFLPQGGREFSSRFIQACEPLSCKVVGCLWVVTCICIQGTSTIVHSHAQWRQNKASTSTLLRTIAINTPPRTSLRMKSRPPTVLGTLHARIVSLVLETYRFATQDQGISPSQTISHPLMEATL